MKPYHLLLIALLATGGILEAIFVFRYLSLENRLEEIDRQNDDIADGIALLDARTKRLVAEYERQMEPQILASLQQNGCHQGAELYERLMDGEDVMGSRQGLLCLNLSIDALRDERCESFAADCDATLCLVEPHLRCEPPRLTEDGLAYRGLKAPTPASDHNN